MHRLPIALLLALAALCLLGATNAHADGWQDKLGGVIVAAPNSGPAIGAGLSYQLTADLYADLFAKREEGGTALAAGLSTELQEAAQFAGKLLGFDVPRVPAGAAVGAAIDTTGGMLFYAGWHTRF